MQQPPNRTSKTREPTVSRSFRLRGSLVETLQARAAERNESANSLAERLIDEGLRREEHPLIVFRDGAGGRRPAIVGTRLDVWQVIETLRSSTGSVTDTAAYLELPESLVEAALRYYAAHELEVEDFAARMRAAAEREHELWVRRQAIAG